MAEHIDTSEGGTMTDKRKRLVRVGVVVLALIVFIIVPGYLSSRPTWLQRYTKLDPSYQTWATSVHAKVTCQQCHVPPRVVPQVAYHARMLGEFYLSFAMPGREPKIFPKPTNAACQRCHIDLRTVSPKGDLNIPHRAHVGVLKLECIRCHKYLVHAKSPEGKNTPTMAGCLTCHDGKTAKNGCSTCHTNKLEPLTHRAADWRIIHAEKVTGGDCTTCHKWNKRWCSTCHALRPRSHTGKWRAAHGAAVKVRRNCEVCHEAAFCERCHGELPKLNYDPAVKLVTN